MKRFIKWFLIGVLILAVGLPIYIYYTLSSSKPFYEGELAIEGLHSEVQVSFDAFGIPSIEAGSSEDALLALGYLHAQERLFQMELLRRAGTGTLAELLGKDLLKADELFCTLGFREYTDEAVKSFQNNAEDQIKSEVTAYLAGINAFIASGKLPPEFKLISAECRPYEVKDLYAISNYMAFSFALGQRTDPLADWILRNLGPDYLKHTALLHYPSEYTNAGAITDSLRGDHTAISAAITQLVNELPLPAFQGSNSWAVSGKRTASGFPILCNDTHMRHAMPSVWFEAGIHCPEFELYGNYIPGIPYPLIGHSERHAWGVTMLEQDDMDFYIETLDSGKANISYRGNWRALDKREYEIVIAGDSTKTLTSHWGPHGPLVNEIFDLEEEAPVSAWWDFTRHPNSLLEVFRTMGRSREMLEFESALSDMHGPGLNIQYADNEDNIAWWATGRLIKRPAHVLSKVFLDGSSGEDDMIGYYRFDENPRSVNPANGVIKSANEQPGMMGDSTFYPGYYKPQHRGKRIEKLLSESSDWTIESMKSVINDVRSDQDAELMRTMISSLNKVDLTEAQLNWLNSISWDGDHELQDKVASFYYKWLFHCLHLAMADELGEERFEALMATHWIQRGYEVLLTQDDSPWWENAQTSETETRRDIITLAYTKAWEQLSASQGNDPSAWKWEASHTLAIEHPMGKVKPLNKLFNIGPKPIRGGYETISQTYFHLSASDTEHVLVGPQMRIIHDLSDPNNSLSVHPAGQSGHPLSDHYSDQFEMYLKGEFRPQTWTIGPQSTMLIMKPLTVSQ